MNCLSIGKIKMSYFKLICFNIIIIDCVYQVIIITYWQKVDTKAFFPFNVGISMSVLI